MGDWPTLTLGDAGVELIDCVHKTPAAQEVGYPYVGIPQMKGGWIDFESARRISRKDFIEWTKKARRHEHDVILSRRTNPGVTATDQTGTEFALGQNRVLLRADGRRVYPPFLKWLVRTPTWWGQINKFINVGAVFNSLKCADVPNFELPIPPLDVQREMCVLLGSLDEKIQLNRRMNETLDATARTLFKDWFVDFGPTRAKAEGRGPYLAPEIWDLFPDALDDEDKPVGWERRPLDEVADFLNGIALQKFPASNPQDSLPVIKIAELGGGSTAKTSRASRDVPDKYIVTDGDFLFSWSGSLTAKFWTEGEGALNQHLFKVSSNRYPAWFFSQWVHHHLQEFQAIAASKATTMGHIQRRHLKEAMTICPTDSVIFMLGQTLGPLLECVIQNQLENRTLAATRDLLLPKLMSGEIRLADTGETSVEP